MQISSILTLVALAASVAADLHNQAVCVKNRVESPVGGTAWSVSYTWSNNYEIEVEATKCACEHYKNRNTGDKQWDQCPDCKVIDMICHSDGWHIGGDEMNYYCSEKCGAQGSEAN
ncbi:hypothetical protein QIS74_12050 [Colletotrichum tabaci]|uniref:Uncharacterized protein n=1 Tax=Colletotrichum tabaci TaxID=1209068 RepID=A0AAV9SVR9_9PEZI